MKDSRIHFLEREQWLDRPLDEVFAFYGDARNLEAITPPLLGFSVLTPEPIEMRAGTRIDYKLRWHAFSMRWTTLIECWDPPHRFVDTQIRGPYRLWHHTHTFEEVDGGTRIRDAVRYRLPAGPIGEVLHRIRIRRDLEAIFDYRAAKVAELLGTPVRA